MQLADAVALALLPGDLSSVLASMLLKQLENLGDEAVVARWGGQNPCYQYFCGMTQFQWKLPCDPSELVYFWRRIEKQGVALILAASAR